jgi:iron complex transport system substrate-binding protein
MIKPISLLFLSLFLASCTTANTQPIINYNTSSFPENKQTQNTISAKRVVALTSLSADIIYHLDKNKLVGRPGSRLLNQSQGLNNIPRVSEGQTLPNLEKIVALKPDLVIGAEEIHDNTLQKLQQLGVATLTTKTDSWSALEALTKNLAKSINADPEPLLKKYQTLLEQKPTTNPSTLILVSRQPILAPNKDSWAGDMLVQFNGKNIAAQLQGEGPMSGYITLSAEKILQADPEIIILIENNDKILNQFKSQPFWSGLKAVKNNRVYVFDYYGLVNPGSIDAIAKASNQLGQVLSSE